MKNKIILKVIIIKYICSEFYEQSSTEGSLIVKFDCIVRVARERESDSERE